MAWAFGIFSDRLDSLPPYHLALLSQFGRQPSFDVSVWSHCQSRSRTVLTMRIFLWDVAGWTLSSRRHRMMGWTVGRVGKMGGGWDVS